MKKFILIFVSLVFVLALAIPAFTGESNRTLQIIGTLEGSLEFVLLPGADPSNIYAVDELGLSSGIVRGLGLSHMFQFQRPDPDSQVGGMKDGHFKIVTASNDIIIGTYEGGSTEYPPWFPFLEEGDELIGHEVFIINGGTGRFENADGEITATAYVTFMGFDVWEWPVTWVLEGEIYY